LIELDNGEVYSSICINCPNHPCLYFSSSEIDNSAFPGIPHNKTRNVCIVNAIYNTESGPVIHSDECIACGVCFKRCPVKAINIDVDTNSFYVNKDNIPIYSNSKDPQEILRTQRYLKDINIVQNPSKKLIDIFRKFVELLMENLKYDKNLDNLICRNMLLAHNIPTKLRSLGDTNFRIEMVSNINDYLIAYEVDVDQYTLLDSPRTMLDDLAVLISRHKYPKEKIIPYIITLNFPNKRTDFYEVLNDIHKVLGIRINVISIALLYLLLFDKIKLNEILIKNLFNLDREKTDIREEIIRIIPYMTAWSFIKEDYFGSTK